ncbi:MAG TPA: ATP-binding cassette domain-containing protein, partial [Terriglobales bacterium]|nr:ATP-binding cassette domain-containing protein [Terriglobales bacterium]
MNDTPLIRLDEVVLRYEDKAVLDGVTFSLFPKDRLVILGQSGSGKSTTLRLILGILRPTSGAIYYRHLKIQKLRRSRLNLLRSRMGVVYQYSALISSMTVRDNLALPVEELCGKPRKEIDAAIKQNLELVGMSGSEDSLPSELSGGMRKRISIARALMMNPEILLFDEP